MNYLHLANFIYVPGDEEEAEKFSEKVQILAEWLDKFEIVFSRSRCKFGRLTPALEEEKDKDILQVLITHKIVQKESGFSVIIKREKIKRAEMLFFLIKK